MDNNILLVGCGYWGKIWYKTLLKQGHRFSVVDPALPSEIDENGIDHYTWDDLSLHLKHFTHAIVATPAETHVSVFNALKGTIAPECILVEKPCGTSVRDSQKLDGCFPGYLQIHSPAYQYLKANLHKVGNPWLYKSIRASMGPRVRSDVTIVEDYLVHDLYLFADLFGSAIQVLNSQFMHRLSCANSSDTVFTQLRAAGSDVLADMFSSWWYPHKERKIIVSGDRGSFIWVNDDLFFTETRYDKGVGKDKYGNSTDHLVEAREEKITLSNKTCVELELEDFLNENPVVNPNLVKETWNLMERVKSAGFMKHFTK